MFKKISIICATALSIISSSSFAQNNTLSPYTRYGYGELADNLSGRIKSMGGTALGMRSKTTINSANPASYSSIDSMCFMFEIGASGKQSTFTNNTQSLQSFTGNLDYMSFQLPLGKYIALSGGIQPFSFVGYNLSSTISDTIPTHTGSSMVYATSSFTGSGSTNQLYGGLSAKLGKHFSAGININYIFGDMEHKRKLDINNDSSVYKSNLTINDINFRYGIQYFTNINKNHNLTIGAIFENKSKLGGSYTLSDYTGSVVSDTISKNNDSDFETPLTVGLGVSYGFKDKLVVGADVLFQNWANAHFFGLTDTLKNRTKISLGGEYRENPNAKNYFKRMTYRLGANMSNSYISINGESPLNYGITFGLGLPARGNKSLINLGFEYGRVGKASATQMQEDYFKFSLSATFNETWFFKRRLE